MIPLQNEDADRDKILTESPLDKHSETTTVQASPFRTGRC